MERATELENRSTISSVVDKNGLLQSFVVNNPPTEKYPEGSKLVFDLSEYSRQAKEGASDEEKIALATSNKALRDGMLEKAKFLAENVPAFTPLMASIAESGAENFKLKNPDATRFGVVGIPNITEYTTSEGTKIDSKRPVIIIGNLDKLDDFSQVGYETAPKNYKDINGEKKDLRPAVMLLQELSMASKDIQSWPLPLAYDGGRSIRNQTIGNVMKAGFFRKESINFNDEDTPTLEDLKNGVIPKKLQDKGYPEPKLLEPELEPKQWYHSPKAAPDTRIAKDETSSDLVVRNQILENLRANPNFLSRFETVKQDVLSV